jgi:hypothetical protein
MRFHLPALDMSLVAASSLYKDSSQSDRQVPGHCNLFTDGAKIIIMSRCDSKQESPAHHPIALLPAAASVLSLISGFNRSDNKCCGRSRSYSSGPQRT